MTKIEKILQYLLDGNYITQMIAIKLFYCYRLSDVIFKLKNKGYLIESKLIHDGDAYFGKYWIEKENLKKMVNKWVSFDLEQEDLL